MAGVPSSDYECPVCHEDYTTVPKLLPCNHRVCRECVLSWLEEGGGRGTCPLCRDPILPDTRPPQGDLATLVDSLPTDLATLAVVESHKVLHGRHVCGICENNVTATSFCLNCDMKLCKTCADGHKKYPAFRNHALEELKKLTAQRLAAVSRSTCQSHDDRHAELYCSAHQELICLLCSTTSHRGCPAVKTIADSAEELRSEVKQQAQRLRDQGTAMFRQTQEVKEKFEIMRKIAKDTFEDLQQCLDQRHQEVIKLIQEEENACMTSLVDLEKLRAAVTSHTGTVDDLLTSAPDDAFLQMMKQLKSRLDDLESGVGERGKLKAVGDITFTAEIVSRIKFDISTLGQITRLLVPSKQQPLYDPTLPQLSKPCQTVLSLFDPLAGAAGPQATARPRGADLARVLKVGDKVKLTPEFFSRASWRMRNKREGKVATVTAIPSEVRATWALNPQGWVDVLWHGTGEIGYYPMGHDDRYDLDLL